MLDRIARPAWVSPELYPFAPRFFETPIGRMHYVDEGSGRPLVFVHGNPSWSFEFRKVIAALSGEFRCIAVDHLGFGLSDKNVPDAERHPQRHAARLRALLEHLDLSDVTLVLGDWGAAMGLDFVLAHPDRVSGLVFTNGWAWPVNGDLHFEMFSWMMASPMGQFWLRYFNIFVNLLMPMAVGVKSALTSEVMDHYRGPFENIADRQASPALPFYILAARPWLEEIWNARAAFADKPAAVIWGGADIAFREREYKTWKAALHNATCHFYRQVGHIPCEEIPDTVAEHIRALMAKTAGALAEA
jgi:haloalkane dehalogenase